MDRMVEGGPGTGAGRSGRPDGDAAAGSRARWGHLTDEEFAELLAGANDPGGWAPVGEDGFVEPIIGWSVVFPKDGALAELLFRSEAKARLAAQGIPDAVVNAFLTPDASWHQWRDAGDPGVDR